MEIKDEIRTRDHSRLKQEMMREETEKVNVTADFNYAFFYCTG